LFLARFPKIEAHLWNIRIDGRPDPHNPYYYAIPHALLFKQLDYLQRRVNSAERHFRQDLDLLVKLQAARKKAAPAPEPIPQPVSPEPVEPEIGLVPANRKVPQNLPAAALFSTPPAQRNAPPPW